MGKWTQRFQKLRAELKPMPFGKKIDHLWTYYKEYLLVGTMVLLIAGGMLFGLLRPKKELLMAGSAVNVQLSVEGEEYLTDRYFQALGGDEKKQYLDLNQVVFGDLSNPSKADVNYEMSLSVLARAEAQMLDYLILDESALEYYIGQDFFLDLRTFFSPEEMADWAERVIYTQPEGAPEMYPVAIVATQLPFFQDCVDAEGPVYLAFVADTPRQARLRDFWTYLLAWEPPK